MIVQFAERILEEIKDQKTLLINSLASGGPATYEDYKFMIGELKGLNEAEFYIRTLMESYVNE